MILDADGDRDGEVTLVFTLDAARALADPAAAFADAREWSRYVGIVDDDGDAVDEFVAEHGLERDYAIGDRDRWLAMDDLREAADTPRHVLVGASPADRRLADAVGWELVTPREAAEKADWALARDEDAAGSGWLADVVARVRDRIGGGSP